METGTKLGHYEIREPLGAGGMGEVYRAHDTNLKRDVAIKVLPEDLAADQERLARLEREAHLLAALNHPNIAQIYSLEESELDDGGRARFLVLELAEGRTLDKRLASRWLDVEEALEVAKQIAQALEAAHDQGIIHRDLKPSNVTVTDDGKVKVLDFGLAKAFEAEGAGEADLTRSPTITVEGTKTGVIMGTAAYMSPEQAKGKTLDKRTDIFSFGSVLYEMLTGRRPFIGDGLSETMASILKDEPDWSPLPANVPPTARALLRRCLRKDLDRRLHDIADARIEIEEALGEPAAALDGLDTGTSGRRIPLGLAAGAVVGVALVSALSVWVVVNPRAPEPRLVQRYNIRLDPGPPRIPTAQIDISPDGSQMVFGSNLGEGETLYHRSIDQPQINLLGLGNDAYFPELSPNGEWLAFGMEGDLWKVRVSGGEPIKIYPGGHVVTWESEDSLIMVGEEDGSLWRISADGSGPDDRELVAKPDLETGVSRFAQPAILPGGKGVVAEVHDGGGPATAKVGVISFDTGEVTIVAPQGNDPLYSPTGHILYARGNTIEAVRFSLESFRAFGLPVTVHEGVRVYPHGRADFDLSDNGLLVYVPGLSHLGGNTSSLVWVARDGNEELVADSRDFGVARLSPDGSRIAVEETDEGEIWLLAIEDGTWTKLTAEGWYEAPLWTPKGDKVVFASRNRGLFWRSADFTDALEELVAIETHALPSSWSEDGTELVFQEFIEEPSIRRILVLPTDGDRTPRPILVSGGELNQTSPAVSPDGRWIAYVSNVSGQQEVYVRPFPEGGARRQISTDGGFEPRWSPYGNEIFYRDGKSVIAVQVRTEPEFRIVGRVPLFEDFGYWHWIWGNDSPGAGFTSYDYDPRADRFLMIADRTEPADLHVIVNFFEELKRLVPIEQ